MERHGQMHPGAILERGFVTPEQFERLIEPHNTSAYGRYLRRVLQEHEEKTGRPLRRAS